MGIRVMYSSPASSRPSSRVYGPKEPPPPHRLELNARSQGWSKGASRCWLSAPTDYQEDIRRTAKYEAASPLTPECVPTVVAFKPWLSFQFVS
ncbi:hypothetical protein AMECASPLE_003987 [Ameca splendens]|uniref:Uncharacterized protein n=1 Tax=Ameca splendens TaxID=208324 RepID=A0ABV0XYX1_9TELE